MKYTGKAIRDNDFGKVPCIGIASHNKVMLKAELSKHGFSVWMIFGRIDLRLARKKNNRLNM